MKDEIKKEYKRLLKDKSIVEYVRELSLNTPSPSMLEGDILSLLSFVEDEIMEYLRERCDQSDYELFLKFYYDDKRSTASKVGEMLEWHSCDKQFLKYSFALAYGVVHYSHSSFFDLHLKQLLTDDYFEQRRRVVVWSDVLVYPAVRYMVMWLARKRKKAGLRSERYTKDEKALIKNNYASLFSKKHRKAVHVFQCKATYSSEYIDDDEVPAINTLIVQVRDQRSAKLMTLKRGVALVFNALVHKHKANQTLKHDEIAALLDEFSMSDEDDPLPPSCSRYISKIIERVDGHELSSSLKIKTSDGETKLIAENDVILHCLPRFFFLHRLLPSNFPAFF